MLVFVIFRDSYFIFCNGLVLLRLSYIFVIVVYCNIYILIVKIVVSSLKKY